MKRSRFINPHRVAGDAPFARLGPRRARRAKSRLVTGDDDLTVVYGGNLYQGWNHDRELDLNRRLRRTDIGVRMSDREACE